MLTVDDILSNAFESKYQQGQVLRFRCGNLTATLAGYRFKAKESVLVELCTDWDGQQLERGISCWELKGERWAYTAGTLRRIAQRIQTESGWEIWNRLEPTEGLMLEFAE